MGAVCMVEEPEVVANLRKTLDAFVGKKPKVTEGEVIHAIELVTEAVVNAVRSGNDAEDIRSSLQTTVLNKKYDRIFARAAIKSAMFKHQAQISRAKGESPHHSGGRR